MTKKVQWYLVSGMTVLLIGITSFAIHSRKSANNTPNTSALSSAVDTNQVTISGYMFMPMTIRVKVGTTVTWTNQDQVHHSVTADKTSEDAPNGPLIDKGQTYSFTFNKTGTYTIHCMPHPYMHGTVVVTD